MEEKIDTKKILEMLKDLAVNQAKITKCDVQLLASEKRQQISECVKDVREDLTEKAKLYGVKIDRITTEYEGEKGQVENILEKYKGAMEDVAEPFDRELKAVEEQQSNAQTEFISLVANFIPSIAQSQSKNMKIDKEIKNKTAEVLSAISEGNYNNAIEGLEEVQKYKDNNQPDALKTVAKSNLEQMKSMLAVIEQCKREKYEINNRRREAINEVKVEKNTELTKVQKQNMVQRIMGSIFSKFNGTKKFMKNAIDPLKDTISEIKDTHIPNIKASAEDRIANFQENLANKKQEIENAVTEKVDQYAEKLATAKENTINNIKTTKEKLSNGIKDAKETAQIEAMIAKDFVSDKVETVQIYGMEAKDKIADKIENVKDWTADKIETAQIIGMVAKDKVIARKNAIMEGAVNIKNAAIEKADNAREGAKQFMTNARDEAIQVATDVRNEAVNTIVSARNLIIRGIGSVGNAGKNTYKSIVNKGLQTRMNIITSMQRRLEEQEKEIQEKMAKLNIKEIEEGYEK